MEYDVPKGILFVVNEPGEFKELVKLADALTKRGSERCIFVFCRPDYVAYGPHSDICAKRGYRSILVNPTFSTSEIPFYLHEAFQDDYVPTQRSLEVLNTKVSKPSKLLRAPNSRSVMMWRIKALLTLPLLAVIERVRPKSRTASILRSINSIRPAALQYKRMKQFIYAVCKWEKIDIIIFGQDYAGSFNSVTSLVAKKVLNIPVVTLPFAMGTTKELNEALFYYPEFRADANRLSRKVAKSFPRWVNVYKGKRLLRLPPWEIIAAEIEGATAPFPWLPYSGHSYFLAPSQQARVYYIRAGMNPELIHLTGSFNDNLWSENISGEAKKDDFATRQLKYLRSRDEVRQSTSRAIADAIGSRLEREANPENLIESESHSSTSDFLGALMTNPIDKFELNKRQIVASNALAEMALRKKRAEENEGQLQQRLLIVSWPTNQFSRPVPGLEFTSHKEVSRFWAETLRDVAQENGAMVMVSLHPTLLGDDYSWLEHEFGFTLWSNSLTDILPLADIFVSCVSSTLIWAANLGVPSINYDCYRYGYREFDETGVIKTASSKSDFIKLMDRIFSDQDFYNDLKRGAELGRGYWGFFDGRSEERIVKAIVKIVDDQKRQNVSIMSRLKKDMSRTSISRDDVDSRLDV